jgi:tripartite-type tricarboxylate transporter receptor subunit TctC
VNAALANAAAHRKSHRCPAGDPGMRKQLALGLAFALGSIAIVWAQPFPSRAITLLVPFGAGGPADTIGRILAEGMRGPLGQPIVVENVVGASGTIGVGRVAGAPADGYTSVLGNWATHVLNGAMFVLRYDLLVDFEPVALVSSDPLLIVARKTMPANDLKEFIAWLKANPDQATQGTTGAGGISTVGGLFFQRATGTQFRFVPYRGGLGPAMQDLIAGQIDFMIDTAGNSLPQVRAGTIKAYALTAKSRLPAAPDIPTVDEAGLSGLYALNWQAVFVPKGTPKGAVTTLNSAVVTALADPTVRRRLADIGQEIFPSEQQTPQALAAFQRAEIEKWWPMIKAANIKAE